MGISRTGIPACPGRELFFAVQTEQIFHFSFFISHFSLHQVHGCLVASTELLLPNPMADVKPVLVDAMTNEKWKIFSLNVMTVRGH